MGSSHSQRTPDKDTLKILYYNARSIVYKIDELSTIAPFTAHTLYV